MSRHRIAFIIAGVVSLFTAQAYADVVEVFKNETPKLVVEGKEFTEGPTLDQQGNILFTAPKLNSIIRYSISDQSESLFYQGEHPVSALYFRDGDLYATQGALKRLIKIQSPDEFISHADSYQDKPFNKPNDLWVSPKGNIYFTDPNYGRQPLSQDGEFAYMVSTTGKVSRIDAKFVRPNGIVGTEDGKTLFITDALDSKTYTFQINDDGTLGAQTLFTDIGGDGMTLDKHGNLYIAVPRQKALVAIDPSGKEIARISNFGCTNVCFGPEGKILYITKNPGLWTLKIY